MKRTLLRIAAITYLAAGAGHLLAAPIENVPHPISDVEKAAIRELVSLQLRDPDSARFRWNPEITDKNLYCGFVNAKNAFGGYVGYRVFWVNFYKDGVRASVSARSYDGTHRLCSQEGYNTALNGPGVASDPETGRE